MGPNLWPSVQHFRRTTTEYFQRVSALGEKPCAARLNFTLDWRRDSSAGSCEGPRHNTGIYITC